MPKAKSKGVGKRRTGGGRTKNKANKQAARSGFETRHIDQVHIIENLQLSFGMDIDNDWNSNIMSSNKLCALLDHQIYDRD